ncbi:MAG: hypothetical protein AB1601_07090 [Planctomycetota bacterium]
MLLALDDTLARKRGLKILGVGMHHDPLLVTREVALTNRGHSAVVLGVILRFPFRPEHVFCLPILFRLHISKQTSAKRGLSDGRRGDPMPNGLRYGRQVLAGSVPKPPASILNRGAPGEEAGRGS